LILRFLTRAASLLPLCAAACMPVAESSPATAPAAATPPTAAPASTPMPAHDTPQPYTLHNTEVRPLPRSRNGRDYVLYVALPASYGTEREKRYPVLYLCDGYWDFGLVKGFYGNLVYDKVVPEFILVGLGYQGESPDYDTLRVHDLTPVAERGGWAAAKDPGHAAEFLAVVEAEIVPFMERSYRADPGYRVLGGSSLGGLFALYVLFTKPALFQAYIAPSPAVSWADGWLFSQEAQFAAAHPHARARLFMTGAGAEAPDFLAAIQRMDGQLKAHAHQGLSYEFRLVEGERHAGTKAESYNRGVRFAFAPLVTGK
jgi:predicted alpha/beta superfamily hydrolase